MTNKKFECLYLPKEVLDIFQETDKGYTMNQIRRKSGRTLNSVKKVSNSSSLK